MTIAYLCVSLLLLLFPLLGAQSGLLPLAVFGLLVAGGWIGWALARPTLRRLPFHAPLAVLLLITLVTTVTSVYRYASLQGIAQLLVVTGAVALIAVLPWERRQAAAGLVIFAVAVIIGELYGLYGWLTWLQGTGATDWRVQSTWENPNFYAGFLIISLPLLAVTARLARAPRWRWLFGTAIALGLIALVMSQSRGGLLAFFLMALFLGPAWLRQEGKLSSRGLGLLAGAMALVVILALLSPMGKRILDPATRARQLHSQMFRYYTWQGALRMVAAHPLTGSGPNTFASAFGPYQIAGYTRHAHSIYLHTAAELGWPGAAALVWLLLAIMLIGHRARCLPATADEPPAPMPAKRKSQAPPPPDRWQLDALLPEASRLAPYAGMALIAATLGLMLHGLVDADWYYSGIQLALLLQAVLVWRLLPVAQATTPAPNATRLLVPGAAVLLALAMLPAAHAEQLAEQAKETTANADRARLYEAAVRLAPSNAAYLRWASCYVSSAQAVDYLQRAMRVEPTNAANWLFAGHQALAMKHYREAIDAYATAEQKQPHLLPALYGMAQAAWMLGDRPTVDHALARILETVGTPLDLYHPVEVPEPWYPQSWFAEGRLAERDHDAKTAIDAYTNTITAVQQYDDGFRYEAEAWAEMSDTQGERAKMQALASMAHESLAQLLATRDPQSAAEHRSKIISDLHLPADIRTTPFP